MPIKKWFGVLCRDMSRYILEIYLSVLDLEEADVNKYKKERMKNNSQKDSVSSRIKVLCSDLRNFRADFIRGAVAFGLRRAKDIPDKFKPKDKDLPGSVEYRLRISFGANQHKFRLWTDHETYSWTINSTVPEDFIDMLGDIWPEGGYSWLVEKPEHVELMNKKADTIYELSKPLLKEREYRSVAAKVRAIVRHNGGRWLDRLSVEQSYFEDIEKTIEELGNITVRKPPEIERNVIPSIRKRILNCIKGFVKEAYRIATKSFFDSVMNK